MIDPKGGVELAPGRHLYSQFAYGDSKADVSYEASHRLASTGLLTIIRSRTAQAKKEESESRNRCTEETASPDLDNATKARVTSRSVTEPTARAPRMVGTS